ncbi:MAG: hypothetical protein H6601_09690 [Flavobacteriales bacterium]|nr:hypothetical protein [Flavobacteriales bacterium]
MLVRNSIILLVATCFFGCKKCVECEVRLKQSQTVIGSVDEFCGTDKKVEEEEDRLRADYTCIECSVNTGAGNAYSGVLCGDRAFTDSIKASWDAGAADIGTSAQCIYHRDTANVTCVLKQ